MSAGPERRSRESDAETCPSFANTATSLSEEAVTSASSMVMLFFDQMTTLLGALAFSEPPCIDTEPPHV